MFVLTLFLLACDDTVFPGGGEVVDGEGWCGVENLIASECLECHSAASALGGLDLETDPAAILTLQGLNNDAPFIVSGDPAASFFYRKVSGELIDGDLGIMPPTGAVAQESIDNLGTWITDGAEVTDDCGSVPNPNGRFHAVGWSDPDVHGTAFKLSQLACASCHGAELNGGSGPSCDTCHGSPDPSDAWRTDCTFCHGTPGVAPTPPRQIDGSLTSEGAAYPAHQIHNAITNFSTPYSCDTCHVYPESALSPGHIFVDDDTPGVAEVNGLGESWDGASCTTSCHGPDPILATDTVTCGSCHSSPASPLGLSGEHDEHVTEALCSECHDTVNDAGSIVRPGQHVKGSVNLVLPTDITQDANGACTGTCHSEVHTNSTW